MVVQADNKGGLSALKLKTKHRGIGSGSAVTSIAENR